MDSLRRNLLDAKKLWRCATMTRALAFWSKDRRLVPCDLNLDPKTTELTAFFTDPQFCVSFCLFACQSVSLPVCLASWPLVDCLCCGSSK